MTGAPPPPPSLGGAWHVTRGGQTFGPYTWEEVVHHTNGGRIGRGDKLFDPRSGTWAKPSKVPGLLGPGGAATIPAGLAAYAMTAAVILGLLAVLLGWFLTPNVPPADPSMGLPEVVATIEISLVTLSPVPSATTPPTVPLATTPATVPSATAPPTVSMAPEGSAFKGTARLEWRDRDSPGGSYWEDGPCYLWIRTTEWGLMANFSFQEDIGYLTWNGRDMLPLVSQAGSHYVFESSSLTRVDKWKIVVDITDTGMSGTVTNLNGPGALQEIGTLIGGSFSGVTITYGQYTAEAP